MFTGEHISLLEDANVYSRTDVVDTVILLWV